MATAYVAVKHIFPNLAGQRWRVMRPINVIDARRVAFVRSVSRPLVGGYTPRRSLRMIDVVLSALCGRAAANPIVCGERLWHDQRAVDRGKAREWAALGHVQLLWRRARRFRGKRRVEPRQRAYFDGDHPADGDP